MGLTPLHLACFSGDVETVTTLLCHRAEVNVASLEGLSPLHIAVEGAHTTVAQVLIQGIFLMNSQKEKKNTGRAVAGLPG